MDKIDVIIYSKDRPCQLDLLLRSIKDKFLNIGKVNILWDWSEEEFRITYMRLFDSMNKYGLDINPIFQDTYEHINTFEKWTRYIIDNHIGDYYLGLCDDDIFIKETDCSDIVSRLDEDDVNAISLKGGLNIVGNHPNFIYPHPSFIETEPYLKWEWRRSDRDSDWGYPTCVNSYIFKKDYFKSLIGRFKFNKPTNLEGGLNSIKRDMRQYMYSFREQKIINIISNRVQYLCENRISTKYPYTAKELNEKYLNGYIISTENIYNIEPTMGNDEREFIFIKN